MIVKNYKNQLDKFQAVEFLPEDHLYSINGKTALSVTSILKQYVKPFERDYWANIKARQLGVSPEEILSKWEFSTKCSTIKGTLIHQYIHNEFSSSGFIYPENVIMESFGYDPIQTPFNQIVTIVNQFLLDITNKMFSVASEYIVGDYEYLIGGTVDQIFYNKKSNKLEIWDWKTNKEIKFESRYFHLAPLDHIPYTEYDHYSLQLSLYKLIVEKNTGIELGTSYIAWFNENLPKYSIYAAKDYRKEAYMILEALHGE